MTSIIIRGVRKGRTDQRKGPDLGGLGLLLDACASASPEKLRATPPINQSRSFKRKRKSAFQKIKKKQKKEKKKKVELEQRRRNLIKGGLERLKLVTSKVIDHERYREGTGRGLTEVQVLKIALIRLRLAYGLSPFPGDLLIEDSNFQSMPSSFVKPGCKISENGFEIPEGGYPTDPQNIKRLENKQRGERRRRNAQRLTDALVKMCVPELLQKSIVKKELFDCITRCLNALPPLQLSGKELIKTIYRKSNVVIPKSMGTPNPLTNPKERGPNCISSNH